MKMIRLLCLLGLIIGIFCLSQAQEEAPRIATIVELKGTVEVKIKRGPWQPASVGMDLNQGDIIRTRRKSYVLLNLDGKAETATAEVQENSQLLLAELVVDKKDESQKTLLDLSIGKILITAKKLHTEKSKFEVKTPTSIVGVRGTNFSVEVEAIE